MNDELPPAHVVSDDTWLMLLEHGVVDGEPHAVDYFFYASAKAQAVSLAVQLKRYGSAPHVELRRTGRLRLGREWIVNGATAPFALTHATLQAWVASMYHLGRAAGAAFDGWGFPVD
ncbi:ribonuclease E inhibitor RraB [uncultured Friedmanniella sp.]|uniref:ribonuclease E inhibitor RraB n=1 Tax=uncultured Friedmanniella sp. TaxID=335381 RepID=UPI0035CC2E22